MENKLVQIFIPLYDNNGVSFPATEYLKLQTFFIEKFNGVTVYKRAPANGLWKEDSGDSPVKDDLVIFEVVTSSIDKGFWSETKMQLQRNFKQESILIRSWAVDLL